jgi:hypothetical protein
LLILWLSWQDGSETASLFTFFAVATLVLGTLPGLANGVIGTINGLVVGRHRGGWPIELVPLLMLLVVWLWDRDDPKVGAALLAALVPAAFVEVAGFLGQGIGSRGRTKPST